MNERCVAETLDRVRQCKGCEFRAAGKRFFTDTLDRVREFKGGELSATIERSNSNFTDPVRDDHVGYVAFITTIPDYFVVLDDQLGTESLRD